MHNVGDRVGAVSHADGDTVYLFGYGIYEGELVPESGVKFMGMDMHELGHKNPSILLDSGRRVYGCECWWGSEEAVRAKQANFKNTVILNIEEERRKDSSV